ncbi:MAG: hypothetical protein JO269_07415 [Burkholderiaceae bacterium]|nr:hypothetical protein [Burkholderiaceae bacterium]
MTIGSFAIADAVLDGLWSTMGTLPNLLILLGAIVTSALIVSVLGRVIHHMDEDGSDDFIPRSNRDRRSGIDLSPPYMSNTGMVFTNRRSGLDRRALTTAG